MSKGGDKKKGGQWLGSLLVALTEKLPSLLLVTYGLALCSLFFTLWLQSCVEAPYSQLMEPVVEPCWGKIWVAAKRLGHWWVAVCCGLKWEPRKRFISNFQVVIWSTLIIMCFVKLDWLVHVLGIRGLAGKYPHQTAAAVLWGNRLVHLRRS